MREKSHATERPYLLSGLRSERLEVILLVSRSILSVVARATVAPRDSAQTHELTAYSQGLCLLNFEKGLLVSVTCCLRRKNARFRSSCDFVPSCCFRHLSRLALSCERALGMGSPTPWRKN